MKKKLKYIIIVTLLFLVSIVFFYYVKIKNRCYGDPYSPSFTLISSEEAKNQLEEISKIYGFHFEPATKEDILQYCSIRSIKIPISSVNSNFIFYDIPIENHTVFPDLIDYESKIAIIYQTYSTLLVEYNPALKLNEKSFNDIEKEDKYIRKLIKKADSFTEIKEPFQKENTYTVVYVDLSFLNADYYKNNKESALQPYLEKAFESLGYTKKE